LEKSDLAPALLVEDGAQFGRFGFKGASAFAGALGGPCLARRLAKAWERGSGR